METTVGTTKKILKSLTILTVGGLFLGAGFTPDQNTSFSGKTPTISPLGKGGETILLAQEKEKREGREKKKKKEDDISGTQQEQIMNAIMNDIRDQIGQELREEIRQHTLEQIQENRIIPGVVKSGVGGGLLYSSTTAAK
jgi:hypothetical protein